jgi:hypothetical protein
LGTPKSSSLARGGQASRNFTCTPLGLKLVDLFSRSPPGPQMGYTSKPSPLGWNTARFDDEWTHSSPSKLEEFNLLTT